MAVQQISLGDIFRGMMQPAGYGRAQAQAGLINSRREAIEQEAWREADEYNRRVAAGEEVGTNLAQTFLQEGMQGPPTPDGVAPRAPALDDPNLPEDVQRGISERLSVGGLAPVIATGATDLVRGVDEARNTYVRMPRFERNPTVENFAAATGRSVPNNSAVSDLARYLTVDQGKNREVLVNPMSGDVVAPPGTEAGIPEIEVADRDNEIRLNNMMSIDPNIEKLPDEEKQRLRHLSGAFLDAGMTPQQALQNSLASIYGGTEFSDGWFSAPQFGEGKQSVAGADGKLYTAGDIKPGRGGVNYIFVGGDPASKDSWLPTRRGQ